jgi:hypothetical protein
VTDRHADRQAQSITEQTTGVTSTLERDTVSAQVSTVRCVSTVGVQSGSRSKGFYNVCLQKYMYAERCESVG